MRRGCCRGFGSAVTDYGCKNGKDWWGNPCAPVIDIPFCINGRDPLGRPCGGEPEAKKTPWGLLLALAAGAAYLVWS